MWLKVQQRPRIAELLKENNLPFDHYYVYGNQNGYKVIDAGFKWMTEEWEKIAVEIKAV
jgi:predicted SprT family Zn-dependent metalloprotease